MCVCVCVCVRLKFCFHIMKRTNCFVDEIKWRCFTPPIDTSALPTSRIINPLIAE